MLRCSLLVMLLVVGCKKEKREGLPPAHEWGGPVAQGSADPNAGMDPNAGANPHGGTMPMGHPPTGGNPHQTGEAPPMAEKTAPKTLAKRPDGRLTLGPFSLVPPKTWTEKPITSSMRAANFTLPPAKPGQDAELVITYFGESGAGSDEDNITRWVDQMQQPDGKASKDVAKIEKTKVGGQDATIISVAGKYTAMAMGGAQPAEVADAMLLAAIVKSPAGPYYFKITGAKATVAANDAAFRALLTSLKVE